MCDKNLQLIKAVEKCPCLYNYNLPEYSKKENSDKAWHEIATQTKMPIHECKEKWKNLRYGLLRSLRLNTDGSVRRKYYLYDEMEFVLPYIKSFKSHEMVFSQTEKLETDEEITAFNDQEHSIEHTLEFEIAEPPKKKSKASDSTRFALPKQLQNRGCDDSRKMFLLSLLPEVNMLSESQMRIFRRKVLSLLDEISDCPTPYEICLLQMQKESSEELQISTQNDVIIKTEPI